MLALLTNREGGVTTFTHQELKSIPNASFKIDVSKEGYKLILIYDDEAMAERAKEIEQEPAKTQSAEA